MTEREVRTLHMDPKTERAVDFIRESNRIEGIVREPREAEVAEFHRFMALPSVSIDDLQQFVSVYQPDATLRDRQSMNVRVGRYIAPPGGPEIRNALVQILEQSNVSRSSAALAAYWLHQAYETLHPFMDGNGRSGWMLWMWTMREAPLGFLHTWYYQSLQFGRHADNR